MSPVQRFTNSASQNVQLWQAMLALLITLGGFVWAASATYAQHTENSRRIELLERKTESDHDAIIGMQAGIEWIVREMGGDPSKVKR
mgnify:CR=1 FL=1